MNQCWKPHWLICRFRFIPIFKYNEAAGLTILNFIPQDITMGSFIFLVFISFTSNSDTYLNAISLILSILRIKSMSTKMGKDKGKKQDKKITVLQVATLNQPISSDIGYGPIETVIYNIDKGLHNLGHRSIVACSGDSKVTGKQFVTVKQSFGEYYEDTPEQRKSMRLHLFKALERAGKGNIDIIHLHDAAMVECIHKGIFKSPVPIVMTLHVPPQDKGHFKQWSEALTSSSNVYFVPISKYQKRQHHGLVNAMNVIHHGINVEEYPFKNEADKESYLFTIGRITKVKGQDIAIEVARKTGSKLIIAGNIQNKAKDRKFFEKLKKSIDLCIDAGKYLADNDYYEKVMKPLLDCDKQIIYIGEISREQNKLWYRHARATLFPIQWGEPFGLVMIESMACGTPILAFRKGSVPEIVIDGKTGFIVDSTSDMIEAVKQVDSIDPGICRKHVQDNFSIISMAQEYSKLYQSIVES
ncbi:MAG: glycosyltransferase family 4 protein [Nanoarchaeota archaeon]|nr:glycosyltransferase family 4 protein [Nanoarchaeota archaeon]